MSYKLSLFADDGEGYCDSHPIGTVDSKDIQTLQAALDAFLVKTKAKPMTIFEDEVYYCPHSNTWKYFLDWDLEFVVEEI